VASGDLRGSRVASGIAVASGCRRCFGGHMWPRGVSDSLVGLQMASGVASGLVGSRVAMGVASGLNGSQWTSGVAGDLRGSIWANFELTWGPILRNFGQILGSNLGANFGMIWCRFLDDAAGPSVLVRRTST
jgi:hypothetical protein